MDCFKNYIGVLGCGAETPDSGIYINTLPGVTLESIDAVASQEAVTFINVFSDIEDRAILKMKQDIVTKLRERYRLKNITQSVNLGKRIDPSTISSDASWRGFQVNIGVVPSNSGMIETMLQHISVQSLSLYLNADMGPYSPIAVKIVDQETGSDLDTFTIFEGTQGWNEIKVNKRYRTTGIVCVYDASNVDTHNLPLQQGSVTSCLSCAQLIYGVSCSAYLTGVESIDLSDANSFTIGQELFGLTGVFSIGCSFDGIVCDNKEVFGNALLYAMGVELMVETLYTDRMNEYTTIKSEAAAQLKDHFQVQYEQAISNALVGIDINLRNCCIECNAPYQIRLSRM